MVYAVEINTTTFPPAGPFGTLGGLLNVIIPNLFILAGIVLFILLIAGGLMVIIGGGGGDPNQTGKGAKAVTYALLGFAIVFLSYWIVKIIEKVTGVSIFEPSF